MALRLRRDVQKASYYVWFLGAEEAKGLRGTRVINSVLPYLIDRSRSQEPLKVTLQVSHKGIKIVQGSSKHFIPHSAITSSVQTDDIVACVLLLYNPATKCPLHVHAYRCDSESTAEALHQQLQILINRPENQKRFEELETRLGILPPLPTSGNKSASHISAEHSHKQQYQSQTPAQQKQKQQQSRRHETSPNHIFSSSLGSDTGNSTRESECSEEHSAGSPVSRSPPIVKALPLPPQQNNELFDSLAAELRAKLNGNGPPILLPPRDYDTVHRSKGNLAAIELRRCRNSLIVGSSPTTPTNAAATPTATTTAANGKQVSSRGSSGIGSDLAPSPERQELNSSSDDEHWTNEADTSVIALKPKQIPIERAMPIISHHPQLNRKSAIQPPEDSYLRDLPAKPYIPHQSKTTNNSSNKKEVMRERDNRSKTPSSTSWSKEDEIKPIIMRPADYDAKFNRIMKAEPKQVYQHRRAEIVSREQGKLHDTDKYNEINRLLNKKLSLEKDQPEPYYKNKDEDLDDFEDSDPASDNLPLTRESAGYRKENLTDKQKFLEYSSKKQQSYAIEDAQRYGGRHRYADPADLPFEKPTRNKYAAVHRGVEHISPERSDLGHRTVERQRERERERPVPEPEDSTRRRKEREQFSRSNERNPYREPESIPYIQSMEKMMKSSAMRYKSFDGVAAETTTAISKDDAHMKVSQRSKSFPKQEDDSKMSRDYNYSHHGRSDYAPSASSSVTPKDRFKDAKEKFHAMESERERTGSRYDLTEEKNGSDYKPRRHGSIEQLDNARIYREWSDEEEVIEERAPPPVNRSRSPRNRWEEQNSRPLREREIIPPREQHTRERDTRDPREQRNYPREVRPRESSGKRTETRDVRDMREIREPYREQQRYEQRSMPRDTRDTRDQRAHHQRSSERQRDHSREHGRRSDYSPEARSSGTDRTDYTSRQVDKHRGAHPHADMYPPSTVTPNGAALVPNTKSLNNMPKGYRHSYAEPVLPRTGGRVGLAAVNPY